MACLLFILVFVMAVSWPFSAPLAAPSEPSFTAFHPRVGFGEGWKTSVVLVNIGANATPVRLFAYDADGNLLGEISGGPPLLPGERRVYSQEDNAFPERTATFKVQSDNLLFSFLTLESLDKKGLEAIFPTTAPNPVLTFPLIRGGASWWSQLSLLNTGPTETWLRIAAFDRDGNPLAEALLSTCLFTTTSFVQGPRLKEVHQARSTPSKQKRVLINPDHKDTIWLEENQTRQVILQINDLPQESSVAKGMVLGRERFSHATLSPSGNLVAFAVEGFHGWCGLYDLDQKKVRELAFFFEGRVTQLSFSPDGHYLAVEAAEGSGLSSVSLWNVKEAQPLSWQAPRAPSGLPTEVRLQEWAGSSLRVLVRWVGEEEWQTWLLEVRYDQVQSRPLK